MLKTQVKLNGIYFAKVSNRRVAVKILDTSPYGGWIATNLDTGRTIRIKSGGRLSETL